MGFLVLSIGLTLIGSVSLPAQFDIREFHQLILENDMVPFSLLRQQVEDAL
jgi:uncharacterized protein (DUF885 family)